MTADGQHSVNMLRPYWQRHPDVSPRIPGKRVAIARWCDGTTAAVPAGADADSLREFYAGARIVAVMEGGL